MRNLARSEKLHEGLAALYAYESQIPAVAKAKIDGLAAWYGITAPRDVAFFSVHMTADVQHSQTARELLETLCDTPAKCEEAREAAAQTARALYGFLDAGN
jgi:pyrroloquinoline-quinone synthase